MVKAYRSISENQNVVLDMQTADIEAAELDKLSPLNKMKNLLIFALSLQKLLEKMGIPIEINQLRSTVE